MSSRRFEGRDAARDDQQNPLALQHGPPAYHNTRLAKVYSPVSSRAQKTAEAELLDRQSVGGSACRPTCRRAPAPTATAETSGTRTVEQAEIHQRERERERGGAQHARPGLHELGGLDVEALRVGHEWNDGHADDAGDEARDHADHRRQRLLQIGVDVQADAQQAEARYRRSARLPRTMNAQLGALPGRPATW